MRRLLKTGEAARYLNISEKTLQRWDRIGKLVPEHRSPGNRRLYTESQLARFREMILEVPRPHLIVGYCRHDSSFVQGTVWHQQTQLQQFVRSKKWRNVQYDADIGFAENFMRTNFIKLMDMIEDRWVKKLLLTHPDVLCTQSAYEWFKRYAKRHGCEIIIVESGLGKS